MRRVLLALVVVLVAWPALGAPTLPVGMSQAVIMSFSGARNGAGQRPAYTGYTITVGLQWYENGYVWYATVPAYINQFVGASSPQTVLIGLIDVYYWDGMSQWHDTGGGIPASSFSGSPWTLAVDSYVTPGPTPPATLVTLQRLGAAISWCGFQGSGSNASGYRSNVDCDWCVSLGTAMMGVSAGSTSEYSWAVGMLPTLQMLEQAADWVGVYGENGSLGGSSGGGGGLSESDVETALRNVFGSSPTGGFGASGFSSLPGQSWSYSPTYSLEFPTISAPTSPALPYVSDMSDAGTIPIPFASGNINGLTLGSSYSFNWATSVGDVFAGFGSAFDSWRVAFRDLILFGMALVCLIWAFKTFRQL